MRRYCLLLTVHCLLAAGTAAAAPALLRWQTDVARPQPRDWEVFQGETVVLAPVMTEGGAGVDLSGSTCALWYQTNGMAGAWWSVPAATGTVAGEVRATWSPTNDCGAARYNYFVAAASPAGTMYRAHGRLVMRHAPGAAPAILAAPTTLTDALQAWADSRYDPAGTAQTASNALAAAVQAEAAARASGDAALTNGAALGETALQPSWAATGTVYNSVWAENTITAMAAFELYRPGTDSEALDAATAHITDPAAHAQPMTNAAAAVVAVHDTNTTAHAHIRAAIDVATNALIQTYLLGTNAWMSISNQTLTIWRDTNGVPAALWSSAESEGGGGIDPTFTNAVWAALAAKADSAWGQYAPDGSPNPDPAYMTFLNAPATMHASGFQWATYGAYSVMAESGAVAYESGADGSARWGLDLQTNYVGFIRGGSMIVAAKAGAINVTGGGTTNGIAEIDYPYTSGDFPALWFAPALDVPFSVQTGVVWIDNEDGTATVNAPATTPKGFWYATTTVSYDVIFDIRPPALLSGGVFGTTNDAPVVYDSTITVISGGKTYRMPAQEVP